MIDLYRNTIYNQLYHIFTYGVEGKIFHLP